MPADNPTPKPAIITLLPLLILPWFCASLSAIGIVEETVFPQFLRKIKNFSSGILHLFLTVCNMNSFA